MWVGGRVRMGRLRDGGQQGLRGRLLATWEGGRAAIGGAMRVGTDAAARRLAGTQQTVRGLWVFERVGGPLLIAGQVMLHTSIGSSNHTHVPTPKPIPHSTSPTPLPAAKAPSFGAAATRWPAALAAGWRSGPTCRRRMLRTCRSVGMGVVWVGAGKCVLVWGSGGGLGLVRAGSRNPEPHKKPRGKKVRPPPQRV